MFFSFLAASTFQAAAATAAARMVRLSMVVSPLLVWILVDRITLSAACDGLM
jgi:hypothetical protein